MNTLNTNSVITKTLKILCILYAWLVPWDELTLTYSEFIRLVSWLNGRCMLRRLKVNHGLGRNWIKTKSIRWVVLFSFPVSKPVFMLWMKLDQQLGQLYELMQAIQKKGKTEDDGDPWMLTTAIILTKTHTLIWVKVFTFINQNPEKRWIR